MSQYTTEELLFALQVRDLATRLRHEEWSNVSGEAVDKGRESLPEEPEGVGPDYQEWRKQRDAADRDAHRAWHAEHPITSYIPRALEMAELAADTIAAARAAKA